MKDHVLEVRDRVVAVLWFAAIASASGSMLLFGDWAMGCYFLLIAVLLNLEHISRQK